MSNARRNKIMLPQMRCSLCKAHLSSSPIRLLPNETSICGACTPPNVNVQAYRNLPLEIFLKQLSFPCPFQERGCKESFLFNESTEHLSKCVYRSFPCPSLISCNWKGFCGEVMEHFSEQHPGLVNENAEFKLKMNEDAEGVFLVNRESVVFVIKFGYNAQETCLKYDVRFFMNGGKKEGTYKVRLINDADSDCNFSLKTNKCLIFDNSFYDAGNAQILKLSKDLDILDNPTSVKVIIDLVVLESAQDVKYVDYELLHLYKLMRSGASYYPI